ADAPPVRTPSATAPPVAAKTPADEPSARTPSATTPPVAAKTPADTPSARTPSATTPPAAAKTPADAERPGDTAASLARGLEAYGRGDYAETVAIIRPLAERGDPTAQPRLAAP